MRRVTASAKDPSFGGAGADFTRGVSRGTGEPIAQERGDASLEVGVDGEVAREVVPGTLVVVASTVAPAASSAVSKLWACDTGIAPSAVPCSTSAGGFQPAIRSRTLTSPPGTAPSVLHPSYLPDTRMTGSRRPSLARRAAMPAPRLNPTMASGVEAPSTS